MRAKARTIFYQYIRDFVIFIMTKAFISRLIQWVLTSQLFPLNACSAALLLLLLRLHRGWFPFRILFTFRGNGMCARMSWTYFSWMKWESERHSKQAISGKEINTALRQRDICRNDLMTSLLLLIIYRACEQQAHQTLADDLIYRLI